MAQYCRRQRNDTSETFVRLARVRGLDGKIDTACNVTPSSSSKILPSEKSGFLEALRKLDEDGCMYLAYHKLSLLYFAVSSLQAV